MEPNEAINSLEAALRALIQEILGDGWKVSSVLDVEKLEGRRKEEAARRDGATVEQNLLSYMHIYDLRKVINSSWDRFLPALRDKKRFDTYMDRVEDFRNVPMHSRELLPFERDLLSGMAGEIRNLVTIYRSHRAPDREYYPVAESVVDSFGIEVRAGGSNLGTSTGIRLQVGDKVQFSCRGWDAQNRTLVWRAWRLGNETIDLARGNSVTLEWAVTDKDVGEDTGIFIEMASNGKYHRHGKYDSMHIIRYAVDPPD